MALWRTVRLDKGAGVLYLAHSDLNWDNFVQHASILLQSWELQLIACDYGADRHCWQLNFEGYTLYLEFDHYQGCWLKVGQWTDLEVLAWLFLQHKD